VRATTRRALREGANLRVRGRVRRVGGYEVLGRSVPWDWDCVSSTVGSSVARGDGGSRYGGGDGKKKHNGKKKKKKGGRGGGLSYPPFGGMEQWL
jgi:hypothetical protein